MNFSQMITEALYSRMEGQEIAARLKSSNAYEKTLDEYHSAVEHLSGQDAAALDGLVCRLCDLHAQFYYRLGLQDGVALTASDFPEKDLE